MATLRNHPGYWMRDDAEASLARWEADHGVIPVSSAGRTQVEQQELIDRWNKGGKYNRPPYLYEPKRPAWASAHVANGGRAFDTPEWRKFLASSAEYGWLQVYDWDVVHFEYFPLKDKSASGGGSTPVPPAPALIPISFKEDNMLPLFVTDDVDGNKNPGWALLNPRTGKLRVMTAVDESWATVAQKQVIADSWGRIWGSAKICVRQDMLNAIDAIQKTQ